MITLRSFRAGYRSLVGNQEPFALEGAFGLAGGNPESFIRA